jgi:hypothetical protein
LSDPVRNIKAIVFLIVPFLAGCNLPWPLSGPAPEFGPPAQKTAAGKMLPPLYCKTASCAQPAARTVAYVTETKPAKPAALPLAKKPPPQAPSPGGPRLSALMARDELEKLSKERLVFNAPDQMTAGIHERIEAHIAESLPEDFVVKLKALGITDPDDIRIGSSMKARLAGDGFDIALLGDEEKPVSGEESTPWVWDVTPVRAGVQTLLLTVTIIVKIPGNGEERKELPAFTKPVTVAPSPLYSTVRFIRARWPWFIGVFFAAALSVWFLRRRRA